MCYFSQPASVPFYVDTASAWSPLWILPVLVLLADPVISYGSLCKKNGTLAGWIHKGDQHWLDPQRGPALAVST